MSPDKLIYMANQIATFFTSQPEGERVDRVAGHIKDFWDPRMRDQLFEIVDRKTAGIDPLVLSAVSQLREAA
ncbi:formate dehydrogenase subunit delta [Solirhodobacter olei]|uniref:formate dehydrogenase subunit delta n=1 Tax=Solirhodobacter olei TaxID=2493082 RepID=UPI000FD8A8A7|nr:formate dehydrogenase subunit delta [Solirhodobacter olei]